MQEELLKEIGLQDKEAAIYLELLKRGRATPASIAKATGINRATVYSASKTLIQKGVISEDVGGKFTYLIAQKPEDLLLLVEKEKRDLQKKKTTIEKLIEELKEVPQGTTYSIPKIRFIDEDNLEAHFYHQTPIWNASLLKTDPTKCWWGFQDHTFVEHYEKWIRSYWKDSDKSISVKLLTNESSVENQIQKVQTPGMERREVKFFDTKDGFDATIWVVGEYIMMVYTKERPFYLVEIYNPTFAKNLREVFKGLWNK